MNHRATRENNDRPPPAPAADDGIQALLRKPLPAPAAPWSGNALGTVRELLSDGSCIVEPQGGAERWCCPRAASCLLEPGVGDTVLVAGPQPETLYLIAVITQADASRSRIVAEGDLVIGSRHGRLSLQAPALRLHAREAEVELAELRVTALVARFVGRTLETVLDRLSVLARSSFRLTEEVEQVRAGQIDMQATETMRLHAKNTLVTSKALVKVDAEQIHMG